MATDVLYRMREILLELGVSPEVSMLCEASLRREFGGDAVWIGKRPKAHVLDAIQRNPELGTAELARRLGVTPRRIRQLKQLTR